MHKLRGHTLTVRCLEVLHGKQIAVSGSRDSILRVWNVETRTMVHLFVGHHHSVRSTDVAGNHVASGRHDCTCRIWKFETNICSGTRRADFIYAVSFDGKRLDGARVVGEQGRLPCALP